MLVSRPALGGAVLAILMGPGLVGISAATPQVYSFEGLAAGTVVSGQLTNGEVLPVDLYAPFDISVEAVNAANSLAIFDTAHPTGNDPDLGTPNRDFGGPGIGDGGRMGMPGENKVAQGKVLIIPENLVDVNHDGLIDQPNDNHSGGTISIRWPTKGLLHSMQFVDIEEFGFSIDLYDGDQLVQSFPIPALGDNSQVKVNTQTTQLVDRAEVTFASSGALSVMTFEPLGCLPPDCDIDGPASACVGNLRTFTTTIGPEFTRQWSVSGGCTIEGSSTGSSVDVRFNGAGACTVALTVSDPVNPQACTSVCSTIVAVTEQPVCTIDGPEQVCTPASRVFTTAADAAFSKSWSVTSSPPGICAIDGATDGSSITVDFTGVGTCTVAVLVTDPADPENCRSACSLVVTAGEPPSCDITGDLAVCTGNTKTYETTAGDGYDRLWSVTSTPPGICATVGAVDGASVQLEFTGTGTCTLSLAVSDPSDPELCRTECSEIITVSAPPPCGIDGDDTACIGNSKVYTTDIQGYTLEWSATSTPPGICTIDGPADGASVDLDFSGAGTCTLTLTVRDPNDPEDCVTTCSLPIEVAPQPDCSFTGPASACIGNTRVYGALAGAGHSYEWSAVSTPPGICAIDGSSTGSSVTVDFTGAGTCTLSLTVRDANDPEFCASTCTEVITVAPQPPCAIAGEPDRCAGTSGTYSVDAEGFSKSWSVTSMPPGICAIDGPADGSSVEIDFTGAGVCTLSVTVFDPADPENCTSTCSLVVTVGSRPPCGIEGAKTVCVGATGSYSTPAGSGYSRSWSAVSTPPGICSISGSTTGSSVTVHFTGAGTCTLSLSVADPNDPEACVTTCSEIITVTPIPPCNIAGEEERCIGDTGTYTTNVTAPLLRTWSVTSTPPGICAVDGPADGASVDVSFTGAGQCTIALLVVDPADPENCRNSCTLIVDVEDCSPGAEPEACWLTGGGCLNDDGPGHKTHTFGGNVGPQPSGSWEHVVRQGSRIAFNFHSWDAVSDSCWKDDGDGPCSPAAENNNINYSGTGLYSDGNGHRDVPATFHAHVEDRAESGHGPGECGGRDYYEIRIHDLSGNLVFHAAGEISCGNLQIHKNVPGGGGKRTDPPAPAGSNAVTASLRLSPASPNPFSGETRIAYTVAAESGRDVTVSVFDVSGRQVRRLVERFDGPGDHMTVWDGRTDGGELVTGGVYFVRVATGDAQAIARVLFAR